MGYSADKITIMRPTQTTLTMAAVDHGFTLAMMTLAKTSTTLFTEIEQRELGNVFRKCLADASISPIQDELGTIPLSKHQVRAELSRVFDVFCEARAVVVAKNVLALFSSNDALPISDDTCVVCLETKEQHPQTTLRCGHRFHTACWKLWAESPNQLSCPTCRYKPSLSLEVEE